MNAAVVLTPPLSSEGSAIAVVRLCGPGVREFLDRFFSKPAAPGRCVHGELRDGEEVIDDPVVVLALDGSWADVCLHGGAWVVAATLELAGRAGFAVVENSGPPLPPAALLDAPSLIEREVLAHLPLARTDLALRVLLEQPEAWRAGLAGQDIQKVLQDWSLWWLLHPPQVVIVGEPNVGKSTLANQLFGRERSITADLAGTTRDWVGETANIDGLAVRLIDTPGITGAEAQDPIEAAAIAASQAQIARSELVLFVLDATRLPRRAGDRASALWVVNKCDQAPAWNFSSLGAVEISARDGRGMDTLRRRIGQFFGVEVPMAMRMRWWTQEQRQRLGDGTDMQAEAGMPGKTIQ
jgi:small GTP-binding protein